MRILTVVHGFPPAATGGTEVYVHGLVRAFARRFADEVLVLTRDADPSRAEYAVQRETRDGVAVVSINHTFRECRSFEDSYRHRRLCDVASPVIDEFRPDVAHVHHLTCLSTELVGELARRRVPVVFTLNDYWLICHRGQLLDLDGQRCDGPYPDGCPRCVPPEVVAWGAGPPARWWRRLERRLPVRAAAATRRAGGMVAAALAGPEAGRTASARRLAHMRALAPHVSVFLAPSRTLRERFRPFGISDDRLLDQVQGVDLSLPRERRERPSGGLRLGFIGSLMHSKAPHVLLDAVAGLPAGLVSVTLYGSFQPYHGDDRYRIRLEPLLAQPHVRHAGPIPHADVADALGSLDVVVVPSIWIENAPFVIREAFAAGVPVLASRLGGMAELVEHERSGLLFAPGDSADLGRAIRRLLDEPDLLDRLRAGVPRVTTIAEDAAWTRRVYETLLRGPVRALERAGLPARQAARARLAAVVLNYRTADDTILAVQSLAASGRPVDEIVIVDSGSGDGSVDVLRHSCPGATIVERPVNAGFAAGCNAGIRRALDGGAALVLLVNSDTIVCPDTVEQLEQALDDPRLGIVGPAVLARDVPSRVASCGMRFSDRTGRMRHPEAGCGLRDLALPERLRVDGVSGCAMLVRREVFDRVGLLDEGYFFFFEDLDLCLRARASGLETACVTTAVVYHEGSRSIGRRSPSRLYHATRGHLRLARTAGRPSRPRAALRVVSVIAFSLAHALSGSAAPRFAGVAAVARGVRDQLVGRLRD